MTSPREIRTHLEERARELGFHRLGVAPATPLAEHREFLAQWLAAGYAGEMHYMSEHEALRSDPQRLLEGARSVLCLLVDYGGGSEPGAEEAPGSPGGKIARYARSRDYHIVLKKRLKALGAELERLVPGAKWRPLVDSAPLLERAYAWRAGLGFLGKNTMLLTHGLGSYTLLGELLTDVELEPDPPGEGTCGRCTRCLDACPTDAFVEPGRLDARRCISYWSIELRGPHPPEADLHGWAFGCDICQEVCPYNNDVEHPEPGADFESPRAAGAWLEAARIREIADDAAFEAAFAGTPLMRARLSGLRRNMDTLGCNASDAGGNLSPDERESRD